MAAAFGVAAAVFGGIVVSAMVELEVTDAFRGRWAWGNGGGTGLYLRWPLFASICRCSSVNSSR